MDEFFSLRLKIIVYGKNKRQKSQTPNEPLLETNLILVQARKMFFQNLTKYF